MTTILTTRKKYALALGLVCLVCLALWFWYQGRGRWAVVTIRNQAFSVRLAETSSERTKGLSGTRFLPRNEGMLFIFPNSGLHSFWMKDMYFPLDIIWIDNDYKIVWIEKGLTPSTYPKSFMPQKPARIVLEINAGLSDEFGFALGDSVSIEKVSTKK